MITMSEIALLLDSHRCFEISGAIDIENVRIYQNGHEEMSEYTKKDMKIHLLHLAKLHYRIKRLKAYIAVKVMFN